MKWTIWISILLLCLTGIGEVQAQNDPVLAGMIAAYTEKAEKELKNQEKVMLMQTTGHIWTKEEVQATTDLQREFNNYLNSFRSIVCYAAQTDGDGYKRQVIHNETPVIINNRIFLMAAKLARSSYGLSDLYKRQGVGQELPNMVADRPITGKCTPVSYTHLDVYKRQLLWEKGVALRCYLDKGERGYIQK